MSAHPGTTGSTAEYSLSDDDPLPASDRRGRNARPTALEAHRGRATVTSNGWAASVGVEADSVVHNLEQAALLGKKLVEGANRQVVLAGGALQVSQQVALADVFHAQLETLSVMESAVPPRSAEGRYSIASAFTSSVDRAASPSRIANSPLRRSGCVRRSGISQSTTSGRRDEHDQWTWMAS